MHILEFFISGEFLQYCLSISVILTQYTDQIQEKFDKADITLPNVTILSTDDKSQLGDFSTTAKSVDFSAITKQVSACVSICRLTTTTCISV